MKSKTCTAGYSCGLTCINREKSCSKELTGQSIELCSQLASLIGDKPKVKTVKVDINDPYSLIVKGQKSFSQKTEGSIGSNTYETDIYKNTVSFSINGGVDNYGDLSGLSQKEAVGLGFAALKSLKKQLKEMPNGTVLGCEAYDGDDTYEARLRTYTSMGFGQSSRDGDPVLKAVIHNGKLYPLDNSKLPEGIFA